MRNMKTISRNIEALRQIFRTNERDGQMRVWIAAKRLRGANAAQYFANEYRAQRVADLRSCGV